MKLLAIVSLALAFGSRIAGALPVDDATSQPGLDEVAAQPSLDDVTSELGHTLEARQNSITLQFVTRQQVCGVPPQRAVFTTAYQRGAFDAVVGHLRGNTKAGTYPKFFGNGENLPLSPLCASGQLFGGLREFPILPSNRIYTGGRPGPHRIIVQDARPGLIIFCGVITHSGAATDSAFVSCRAGS